MLTADVQARISEALVSDFGLQRHGKWLSGGQCPQCGKKDLYIDAQSLFTLRCNRRNKCGYELEINDHYRHLFVPLAKSHPPTKQEPYATANEYLRRRGVFFDELLQHDCYMQERCNDIATARFFLDAQKQTYWERLIDASADQRKANFGGKRKADGTLYGGCVWRAPWQKISRGEICVTEGIIDALSLIKAGKQAVSCLSSENYPHEFVKKIKNKNITLVFAFDGDDAGEHSARKMVERAKEDGIRSAAMLPEPGKDWNEVYQRGKLTEKYLQESALRGRLALTESPLAWARIHCEQRQGEYALFRWRRQWHEYRPDSGKAKDNDPQNHNIHQVTNFDIRFLYSEDEGGRVRYCFSARKPWQRRWTQITLPGSAINHPQNLGSSLAVHGHQLMFTGGVSALRAFQRMWFSHHTPEIACLTVAGYSPAHKCYVYPELAFANGRIYRLQDGNYFRIANNYIRPQTSLKMICSETGKINWIKAFIVAFGTPGLCVLVWWVLSLFAEQIRKRYGYFPFLELYGEQGSGKSSLLWFLWLLYGRVDEGVDPNKTTITGLNRLFAQVSNMPFVLVESDRQGGKRAGRVNFDHYKTMYSGQLISGSGAYSNDLQTRQYYFRGSLAFSQNAQIEASEAFMTRLISFAFSTKSHTAQSKQALDALMVADKENLAYTMTYILLREKAITGQIDAKYADMYRAVPAEITSHRLRGHMALMWLGAEIIGTLFKLPADAVQGVQRMYRDALLARQTMLYSDPPTVARFWQIYYMYGADSTWPPPDKKDNCAMFNHSINDKYIAISLPHFYAECRRLHIDLPDEDELRRLLHTSRSNPYCGRKSVKSAIFNHKVVKCLIFENSKHEKETV